MGYRLSMSGEIHDWLADLAVGEAAAAGRVGAALAALLSAGDELGPPVVVPLQDAPLPAYPPDALDEAYQRYLHRMARSRRRVAEAQTLAKRAELQITRLEAQQAHLTAQRRQALAAADLERAGQVATEITAAQQELAGQRHRLPGLTGTADAALATSQRLQSWVNAFRIQKETLKASYIAAQTLALAEQLAQDTGQDETPGEPEPATARLAGIEDQIRDALRARPPAGDGGDLWPAAEPGLAELRPAGDDVRILFAVEPAGTALLIAVLDGDEAVSDQHDEAVALASEQLRQVRAGRAPEAAAHGYADADELAREFFPGDPGRILGAAADLVSGNRVHTLSQERIRLGLSQEQVAARMGVRQERVSAIERAEPGAMEVRTLASYVEALGGQLEIVALFEHDRVRLR